MNTEGLREELNLSTWPISIILSKEFLDDINSKSSGCSMKLLNNAAKGETVVIDANKASCKGAARGCGFIDGIPEIPGGFGNFISNGSGKGCPPGEKVKKNAEVAISMIKNQPDNVVGDNKYIILKPYQEGDNPETVAFIVNPDQLSALVHLFNFEKYQYDNVIAPMSSGCASVFRIPFNEAKKENPRAVIGNIDIFSRPHFPENTFIFVVPHESYLEILKNADDCFFNAHTWNGVKKRLSTLS